MRILGYLLITVVFISVGMLAYTYSIERVRSDQLRNSCVETSMFAINSSTMTRVYDCGKRPD